MKILFDLSFLLRSASFFSYRLLYIFSIFYSSNIENQFNTFFNACEWNAISSSRIHPPPPRKIR